MIDFTYLLFELFAYSAIDRTISREKNIGLLFG